MIVTHNKQHINEEPRVEAMREVISLIYCITSINISVIVIIMMMMMMTMSSVLLLLLLLL